jgi:hypothetical protein
VISPPIKIGITGTHSTGKTSFFDAIQQDLERLKLRTHRLGNFARNAQSIGFPILTDHTYESTLWIMAQCMRLEAEASLSSDVILIDRPVIDALGYLRAALRLSGRTISERRLDELTTIVKAHAPDYDLLIRTSLDTSIELGPGRDQDAQFRDAAASSIENLISEIAPGALILTPSNRNETAQRVVQFVESRLAASES